MKRMTTLAAIAALATAMTVPLAPAGAQTQTITNARNNSASQRRVCTVIGRTGSRLGARTRCISAEEARQEQIEARRTVDRLQAFKPTICSPQPGC